MPTYISQPGGSDVSNNNVFDFVRILGRNTVTTGDKQYVVPASTTINIYHCSPQGTPNSDSWQSGGTFTAEFNVIARQTSLQARCRISRVNSVGTVIDAGTFTGFQTLVVGVMVFSPVAPTWSANESCGNRLLLQFQIQNVNVTSSRNATIRYGDTNSQLTTDITEDTANCRRIFIA